MRNRATRRLGMDLMMLLFLSTAVLLVLVLPWINIPKKQENVAPPPQGNMIIELYWPDQPANVDVDLWVQAPGDVSVGYSNKSGVITNLLRDDLGSTFDVSERNQEIAYTRGLPNGEYIVNAHMFALKDGELPIPIRVIVALKSTDDAPYTQLFAVTGELRFSGEEKTMARFTIRDRAYVEGSFHTVKRAIRAARTQP